MTTLNISDIQRFSTKDGPGIRTTVFLKGCPLHCPWCHNPETISSAPQTLYFSGSGITKVCGKSMTVREVVSELVEDAEFYEASGGGVTVSGGEPLLQHDAVAHLISLLSERGIKTVIDTSGCVPWSCFESVAGMADMYYYDIKSADKEKFRAFTGGELGTVIENLEKLLKNGERVKIRIPFIPGANSSEEDCVRIGELMSGLGITQADLLPFHRLGDAKYEALGLHYAYKDTKPPRKDEIDAAVKVYEKYIGINIE